MDTSQLESDSIGRVIAIALSLVFFSFISFCWVKELLFYRRNGWNFDLDSKCLTMFWGDWEDPGNRMTNSARLKKGYPFFFLLSVAMLLGTIFT